MGIPARGASGLLVRKICESNRAGSFLKASRVLRDLAGLAISPKRVQLTTEQVGRLLAAERDAATDAFLDRAAGPAPDAAPALLVVSADGGRVQTRQGRPDEKWKESKVGLVYDAAPTPERPGVKYKGPAARTKSLVATMDSWTRLGEHLSACAERRGHARADQVVFVSDGATGLRTLRQDCFPDAQFVLDWTHATDHLRRAAEAGFASPEQAKRWYERQKDRLWRGGPDGVIRHLDRLARAVGPPGDSAREGHPARVLANVQDYLRTNRAGLDYPRYRRNGWPLASAQIESTIKQVGKRVKGTEKHWSLAGVEDTLQVATHLIADDGAWDAFWQRRAWTYRN